MKTPRLPPYWEEAAAALSQRDAVMAALVVQHPGLPLRSRGDAFATLARAIVGQQISVAAARSIWQRLVTELTIMRPAAVADAHEDVLRQCGLSAGKALYLRDLAVAFTDGRLNRRAWPRLTDEALIAELITVRGIGRWTAEMFLIFYMARPDVLPLADIGLQRAMRRHYNRGRPLTAVRMTRIAKAWAPWRSVATWYLWRSLDGQIE